MITTILQKFRIYFLVLQPVFTIVKFDLPRSINLEFIISGIFADLCITSDKTRPQAPFDIYVHSKWTFSLVDFSEKRRE